jgi:hypothetical protein
VPSGPVTVTGCKTGIQTIARTATDGGKGDCTAPVSSTVPVGTTDTSQCPPVPAPVPAPDVNSILSTNIYMLRGKLPFSVQPKQMLTCARDGGICNSAQMGQNIALAFTVQLNSPNNTSDTQRIMSVITTNYQSVLSVSVGSYSSNLNIQFPNGAISNSSIPIDSGTNTFYIIYNSTGGFYQIYKNGELVADDTIAGSGINNGRINVVTSVNTATINGNLSSVVMITSNTRIIQSDDLDAATTYDNNN